ncbi:MAG: hypothetical protein L0Y56_06300 [Nitrospira sp.]|nr:hypothetical protein [Nitrospira sp.]
MSKVHVVKLHRDAPDEDAVFDAFSPDGDILLSIEQQDLEKLIPNFPQGKASIEITFRY